MYLIAKCVASLCVDLMPNFPIGGIIDLAFMNFQRCFSDARNASSHVAWIMTQTSPATRCRAPGYVAPLLFSLCLR